MSLIPWILLGLFWLTLGTMLWRHRSLRFRLQNGEVELARDAITLVNGDVRTVIPWTGISAIREVSGGYELRIRNGPTVFMGHAMDAHVERELRKRLSTRFPLSQAIPPGS